MIKTLLLLCFLFVQTLCAKGQSLVDNAYLLRKLIEKDSFVRVPNTGVWLLKNAGLKKDHFGWLLNDEFEKADCNMFYFEMNTTDVPEGPWSEYAPGSFQIAINLPKNGIALNLDTVNNLRYQLINNYTGFAWKKNPTNKLSGVITFTTNSSSQVIVNGTVNIDTRNPITTQKIVFENYSIPILSLEEYLAEERIKKEAKEKQEKKMWGAFDLVSSERSRFYDSVFNLKAFPNNKIVAQLNKKTTFDFTLDNSYILTSASLTDSAKQDLGELLGGNILASIQGDKKVFVFHSFYDPVKNSIDDETNYSLSLELDTIITNKTYFITKKTQDFKAKLAFWHYGPEGTVITSKETSGTLTITENTDLKASGSLNIEFKNRDKTSISLEGTFELPKIKVSDISDLENKIKLKLIKYYSDE